MLGVNMDEERREVLRILASIGGVIISSKVLSPKRSLSNLISLLQENAEAAEQHKYDLNTYKGITEALKNFYDNDVTEAIKSYIGKNKDIYFALSAQYFEDIENPNIPSSNSGVTSSDKWGLEGKNIKTLKEVYDSGGLTNKTFLELLLKMDNNIDIANKDIINNARKDRVEDNYGNGFIEQELVEITRKNAYKIIKGAFNGVFDNQSIAKLRRRDVTFYGQLAKTNNVIEDPFEKGVQHRYDLTHPLITKTSK
jgi:hypothetical protein